MGRSDTPEPWGALLIRAPRQMTSDVDVTAEWMFAAGNYVVAGIGNKGTLDGPLAGGLGPATNEIFDMRQLDPCELRDGKIANRKIFNNAMEFAVQVGLVKLEDIIELTSR